MPHPRITQIFLFHIYPALKLLLRMFLIFCMLLLYMALSMQDILYKIFTDFIFIMHALQNIANEHFCSAEYIIQ